MRLNNRNRMPIYQFFLTLVTLILVIGLGMSLLNIINLPVVRRTISYGSIFLGFIGYILFFLRGRQIFEYDSDGETLNFKNYNIISFLGKEAKDEFPKYKLIKYEIVNALFLKKLYITISSKKSHHIRLSYDISYLKIKELKDLRHSLNKVISENKNLVKD